MTLQIKQDREMIYYSHVTTIMYLTTPTTARPSTRVQSY